MMSQFMNEFAQAHGEIIEVYCVFVTTGSTVHRLTEIDRLLISAEKMRQG